MQDNIPAVLSVMKYIYDNIMYAELNTKSDYCKECGFDAFYDKAMGRCSDCEIYDFCKGGCMPTHNEMLKKSEDLYKEYCEAKKLLINHIKRGVDLALS